MRQSFSSTKPRLNSTPRSKRRPRKKALASKGLLVHVRHTGRVLAHKHTSYPLLGMLFILVGTVMFLNSMLVKADISTSDTYSVHGIVPGVAPISPAVITSPVEGALFTTPFIQVNGSCPINGGYIKLYRNGLFSGAANCHQGSFTLEIMLVDGKNTLQAKVFNQADLPGPDSTQVSVYYGPKVTSSTVHSSSPSSNGTSTPPIRTNQVGSPAPLIISADYSYQGYYTNQQITWSLGIIGGTGPFLTHVDWGDGSDSTQKQASDGQLDLTHTYTRRTPKQVEYIIKITVTDADGNIAFLQLATLVAVPGTKSIATVTGYSNPPGSSSLEKLLKHIASYAWPTYTAACVILLAFWLGEQREFSILHGSVRTIKHMRH
jgi:hypothetical protein